MFYSGNPKVRELLPGDAIGEGELATSILALSQHALVLDTTPVAAEIFRDTTVLGAHLSMADSPQRYHGILISTIDEDAGTAEILGIAVDEAGSDAGAASFLISALRRAVARPDRPANLTAKLTPEAEEKCPKIRGFLEAHDVNVH